MSSEHEVIRDLICDQLQEMRGIREAIASLAAAIAGQAPKSVQADAAKVIEKAAKAEAVPKAAKVETPKPTSATPADAPSGATAPAAQPAESSASELVYDDVAALVIKYSKVNGRVKTVEVLKQFGITSFTAAKPEQFAAIAEAFTAELASV